MKKIFLSNIFFIFLCLLILIHLWILINLRFTPWPEMFSFPYLFSKGFTLYKDMVLVYPPFLVLVLSVIFKIFGYSVWTLKIFTWMLVIVSDILIFNIVKKITRKKIYGILSLGAFVFIQPFLEGNMLWFDNFLVVPLLFSLYILLLRSKKNLHLLFAGLFLAISLFSKQSAVFYLIFIFIYLLVKIKNTKKILLFLSPSIVFGVSFLIYLISTNSLSDFFNWNLIYPIRFWGDYPSYIQFFATNTDYFILGGFLFLYLLLLRHKGNLLLKLMYVAGILAVYPRFSYYHLAFVVSLSMVILGVVYPFYKKYAVFKFGVVVFFAVFFWYQQRIVLAWDWKRPDRFLPEYSFNFPKDSTVYFMNINSSYYVYSNTLPPKPWYDDYGWYLEIPGQQEKIINMWRNNPPEVIIWKEEDNIDNYSPGSYRPVKLSGWIEENYSKKYEISKRVWYWIKN